jgi:cytochrome P450
MVTNQQNYTKIQVPPGESRVLWKGMLHTDGETHHRQRRLLLPFFHGDHVASYTGLITEKAATLTTSWNMAPPSTLGVR